MKFQSPVDKTQYTRSFSDRRAITDKIVSRGTSKQPEAPRDLQFQTGSRGGLLTWKLPVSSADVSGYRVYKDDEASLYEEIQDRGRRQEYIELTATPSGSVAITAIARAANIVTVTVAKVVRKGDSVVVAGVTDASFNGTQAALTGGSTSFTYAQTGANASSSAGTVTAPPVTNLFVSCINAAGIESPKVQVQVQSVSEAAAPSVPGTPPGYTGESAGGGDTDYVCAEEGAELGFYRGATYQRRLIKHRKWTDIETDSGRKIPLASGTLVSIFVESFDVKPGDKIEIGEGEWETVTSVVESKRQSRKQAVQIDDPFPKVYTANGARIHNVSFRKA